MENKNSHVSSNNNVTFAFSALDFIYLLSGNIIKLLFIDFSNC